MPELSTLHIVALVAGYVAMLPVSYVILSAVFDGPKTYNDELYYGVASMMWPIWLALAIIVGPIFMLCLFTVKGGEAIKATVSRFIANRRMPHAEMRKRS